MPDNEYTRWEQDYDLGEEGDFGLFYEYLEMGEFNKILRSDSIFQLYMDVPKMHVRLRLKKETLFSLMIQ